MNLEKLIEQRQARIAVIGLGYVGLPLLLAFGQAGFEVFGFEVNERKVALLKRGFDPSLQKNNLLLKKLLNSNRLKLYSRPDILRKADVIIICVPTPLSHRRKPDLTYIREAVQYIKGNFKKGQLIILESTSYPGTTEEEILAPLASRNCRVGRDFFLAFSPERIDPGNKKFNLREIPKVVGGVTARCTRLGCGLYGCVFNRVYPASSAGTAEMEKLLENIFRSVNIALVNELAMLCRKMGLDIWEVIQLAATKPYGFMPFYPGPGLGGHCIPVDPFYLAWKAREYNFATKFIELAGEINTQMPDYVVSLVSEALSSVGKYFKNSSILVLGVTYKKDIPDTRESPALKILELLAEKGSRVAFHDPFVGELILDGRKYHRVSLKKLASFDCVLLVTDHSTYNPEWIYHRCQLLVDTRGVTRNLKDVHKKIIRL